jgi:hypothetical protein
MRQVTEVRIAHKRALNQAIIHAGRFPPGAVLEPGQCVRALRSALRMSQGQLARRRLEKPVPYRYRWRLWDDD